MGGIKMQDCYACKYKGMAAHAGIVVVLLAMIAAVVFLPDEFKQGHAHVYVPEADLTIDVARAESMADLETMAKDIREAEWSRGIAYRVREAGAVPYWIRSVVPAELVCLNDGVISSLHAVSMDHEPIKLSCESVFVSSKGLAEQHGLGVGSRMVLEE